jgi:hypothetical protein
MWKQAHPDGDHSALHLNLQNSFEVPATPTIGIFHQATIMKNLTQTVMLSFPQNIKKKVGEYGMAIKHFPLTHIKLIVFTPQKYFLIMWVKHNHLKDLIPWVKV